jgi:hypothetical protein
LTLVPVPAVPIALMFSAPVPLAGSVATKTF